MAYGPNAVGKDGNRGVDGASPGSDAGAHLPDGFFASVGSLSAPQGKTLGQPSPNQNRASRQNIPGSAEVNPREQYNFQSGGEGGYLGQDTDDYGGGTLVDSQRPTLPNPEFAGASGTTNMGPQGDPVDWAAVAPYEYPEFPMSPQGNTPDPTAHLAQ